MDGATCANESQRDASLLANAEAIAPETFLKITYGSGCHQGLVMTFIGGIYICGFPGMITQNLATPKLIDDPEYPHFDKDSVATAQAFLFVGMAVGMLMLSPLYDKIGRWWMTYCMVVFMIIVAVLSMLAPSTGSVPVYAASLALVGVGNGTPIFAFSYVQENMPRHVMARSLASMNIIYSAGLGIEAICSGTFMLNWDWHLLLVVWWLPLVVIAVMGCFFMYESLPFLVAAKKWTQARRVAEQIARRNGVQMPVLGWPTEESSENRAERSSSFGMVTHALKPLCVRVILSMITWTASSVGFYGLSYSAGELSENMYTNLALLAVVDMVAYFIPSFVIPLIGCRLTQILGFLNAGVYLMICGFLEPGALLMGFALGGRLALDVTFATNFQMNVDIFPAQCRNTVYGITNFASRLLTMAAPLLGKYPASVSCPCFGTLCLVAMVSTCFLPAGPSTSTVQTHEDAAKRTIEPAV